MVSTALVTLALVAGLVLEWLALRLARHEALLVRPNERSSHTQPTPTMGGVVIVVIVLAYCAHLAQTDAALGWGLFGPLAAVGLIGLWDDLSGLSARLRIVVYALAAAAAMWWVLPELPTWAYVVGGLALVWFVNLYNFMDGIDGYAACQALIFCLGAQLVTGGVPGWAGEALWLLAGATLAFLTFNWPPAKIFMGDVGSAFLGLLIGVLSGYLALAEHLPFVAALILLAGFWFDASYTLCVRILTGQAFYEAHRSHLYQRLAHRHGHLWTTLAFLGYAGFGLIPLAWWATEVPDYQYLALCLALVPLAAACWRFGAGREVAVNSSLSRG